MRLDSILSSLLTLSAVAIAVVVVRRELSPKRGLSDDREDPPVRLELVTTWRSEPELVGSLTAAKPIVIAEFVDLECPACRTFHASVLPLVKKQFGDRLSINYVQFPLSFHRFASGGARAAECARPYGRSIEFAEAVYAGQDSLGLKPWTAYARDAGVKDTAAFGKCTRATTAIAKIDSGLAAAKRLKVNATPTLFVNGWRFRRPPSADELSQTIEDLLADKRPRFAVTSMSSDVSLK